MNFNKFLLMLLCELPSKNDIDITDHDFWADDDIYDCSDFKFPDEEGPQIFIKNK